MNATRSFVTLGDLIADLVLGVEALPIELGQHPAVSDLTLGPGGAGNALMAAARLGLRPVALGGIGGDWIGERVLSQLRVEGVDVTGVTVMPGETTPVSVVLRANGGQHVFMGRAGTRGPARLGEADQRALTSAGVVLVDGWTWRQDWPGVILAGTQSAAQAGVPVLFDPGPAVAWVDADWLLAMLAAASILLATEAEADALARRLGLSDSEALAERVATVVVKRGADGCRIRSGPQTWDCAGFPVSVVDPVGAGDCFAAAVAWGLLRGLAWDAIGAVANAVGAAMVQKAGTALAAPTRPEVAALLKQRRPDLAALLAPEGADAIQRSRRAPRCEG